MAQVIVRNLEKRVVDALKMRAELNGHSLEQELRQILAEAARPARREMVRLADRIRAMTPDRPQSDTSVLIRQDRDSR